MQFICGNRMSVHLMLQLVQRLAHSLANQAVRFVAVGTSLGPLSHRSAPHSATSLVYHLGRCRAPLLR